MRTKAQIHCLSGHTNTVSEVRCQAAEPQVNQSHYLSVTAPSFCRVIVFLKV